MAKKKRGLGKGLSALIPKEAEENETIKSNDSYNGKIMKIKLSEIEPNENQPRKEFDKYKIQELAESIKRVGIIQPILVRKKDSKYEIIAGERRYRATKLVGLEEIPCIIKKEDDKKSTEMSLVENIQRQNLNPMEEAIAYDDLKNKYNLTQENLADMIGKSRSYVTNIMRLLNLNYKVKDMIKNNIITSGHGRALLSITNQEKQYKTALMIVEKKLSVRETERLVKGLNKTKKIKKNKKNNDDPIIRGIEDDLRRILGTKVTINKGRKKSKIEIEYYNDEDLDRILEVLNN